MNEQLIKKLAAIHGTPLYIYSPQRIKSAVETVKGVFGAFEQDGNPHPFPAFHFIYSVKANPFEPVLMTLKDQAIGIDAASKNEVLSCARLGFPINSTYYSAPGKSKKDIEACLGTAHIIADSLNELYLIDAVAKERGLTANIGVRLNLPNPAMQNSRFEVMSGTGGKFGIEWEAFLNAEPEIQSMKHLRINGLHVYFGSQLMDARLIADNFKAISRAALEMHKRFPLAYINYGGGFGVPYEDTETFPDLPAAASLIQCDGFTQKVAECGIRMNIELGRYLTAPAGIYVSMAADVKYSGGVTYVILDGGMNTFFRPKFTGQTHRVKVLKQPAPACLGQAGDTDCEKAGLTRVSLVGNTCTPLDVLYENILLPPVSPGDWLVFENAGAYGYSMSLLDFISFDKPAQVMMDWA